MQIVLTLRTYLVSDLQNPLSRFQFGKTPTYMKHKSQEKQYSVKCMKSMLFTNRDLQVLNPKSWDIYCVNTVI